MPAKLLVYAIAACAPLTASNAQSALELQRSVRSDAPHALMNEAFEAAQLASSTQASRALTRISARFAIQQSEIGLIERKIAELDARMGALRRTAGVDERKAEQVAAQIVEASRQRFEFDRQLRTGFPAYAALTRPTPLSIDRVKGLLRDDEALIFLFSAKDASFSFAVTAETATWSRSSAFGREPLASSVDRLREALQSELYDGTDTFDPVEAHRIYRELIAPLDEVLAGKPKLIVVASDPLDRLPLSLLPVRLASKNSKIPDGTAAAEWMIDRFALSALPAVNSLEAFRCFLPVRADRPQVCGASAGPGRSPIRSGPPFELLGFGGPLLAPPGEESKPGRIVTGGRADPDELRKMSSLPGTVRELKQAAAAFPRRRVALYLGSAATETKAKASPELAKARLVLFSTHGLLESESGGEAGLVMTPPAKAAANDLDDGFLAASEVALLSLSADLVVLSACNTGGSGEVLAGLARSFLLAGARSLLVSHWSVSDDATADLVGSMIAKSSGPGPDALRQAMIAVRSNPDFASPAYWSPFVYVGLAD